MRTGNLIGEEAGVGGGGGGAGTQGAAAAAAAGGWGVRAALPLPFLLPPESPPAPRAGLREVGGPPRRAPGEAAGTL